MARQPHAAQRATTPVWIPLFKLIFLEQWFEFNRRPVFTTREEAVAFVESAWAKESSGATAGLDGPLVGEFTDEDWDALGFMELEYSWGNPIGSDTDPTYGDIDILGVMTDGEYDEEVGWAGVAYVNYDSTTNQYTPATRRQVKRSAKRYSVGNRITLGNRLPSYLAGWEGASGRVVSVDDSGVTALMPDGSEARIKPPDLDVIETSTPRGKVMQQKRAGRKIARAVGDVYWQPVYSENGGEWIAQGYAEMDKSDALNQASAYFEHRVSYIGLYEGVAKWKYSHTADSGVEVYGVYESANFDSFEYGVMPVEKLAEHGAFQSTQSRAIMKRNRRPTQADYGIRTNPNQTPLRGQLPKQGK